MSTELRNFFLSPTKNSKSSISKPKSSARIAPPFIKFRKTASNTSPMKSAQGHHRPFQRPRRPPPHARLRQEILLKSWDNLTSTALPSAASPLSGKATSASASIGLVLLGSADYFRQRQKSSFSGSNRQGWLAYSADIRGVLKGYAESLFKKEGYTLNAANEIEGFLFKGPDAERHYHENGKFEYVNTGGYSLAPRRSAPHLHRHHRRSPARHGLPE